jgi:hypothetical protein
MFRYSEKATNFDEIFILTLLTVSNVKMKMEISSNLVAFSEYLNFINEYHYNFSFNLFFLALKEGMMENKVISKVAIVVPKQFYDSAAQFWKKCREIAPSLNVGLSDPFWLQIPDSNVTTYTSAIERQVHGKAPHLVS